MLASVFLLTSVPLVLLLPLRQHRTHQVWRRRVDTIIWIHACTCVAIAMVYTIARLVHAPNTHEPSCEHAMKHGKYTQDMVNGCRVLHYRPQHRAAVRRLLLFPGMHVSVCRMLHEECVKAFLPDAEIVIFQVRGLGDSHHLVDFSASSMLEDALNTLSFFEAVTDRNLACEFLGFSLGCFVSMQLLSQAWRCGHALTCERIILVNGMYDGQHMAPKLRLFAKLLGISTAPHVPLSDVPVSILHARRDATIPLVEAYDMQRACRLRGRSVRLYVCDGTHTKYVVDKHAAEFLLHPHTGRRVPRGF